MPTEEERRKAMVARATRKALEGARMAHDVKVREPFKDYYRTETEALRRKEAEQRAAEIERRKQEDEAARLAKRRQRAAGIRATR